MKNIFKDKYGTVAFYVVICVLITSVLLAVWMNFSGVTSVVKRIISVISPVLYAILAVLVINPGVHLFYDKVFAFLGEGKKNREKLRRILSVISGYLLFIILLIAVFVIVFVPLAENVEDLQTKIPGAIRGSVDWIENVISKTPFLNEQSDEIMNYIESSLIFSPEGIQDLLGKVISYASSIVSETASVIIGLIISVYIVFSMDHLRDIRDKIMHAFFRDETVYSIRSDFRKTYKIFSDYITGRALYSITIGIILFIILALFNVPFYSVISIAMGLLAFVPVSGTMLSYVIGSFLCLIFDPQSAGWCSVLFLVVFVTGAVFLQPHIIRENARCSIGMSVISVIIMYACFGVIGATIGAPAFIAFKRMIMRYVNSKDTINKDSPNEKKVEGGL